MAPDDDLMIALAGPLASGKTTLATRLDVATGGSLLRIRSVLMRRAGLVVFRREALQSYGARLEAQTGGAWIVEEARRARQPSCVTIIDAVRTPAQATALRTAFADNLWLLFVTAREEIRRQRFGRDAARDPEAATMGFDRTVQHSTEVAAHLTEPLCCHTIDTSDQTPEEVLSYVLACLGEQLRHE